MILGIDEMECDTLATDDLIRSVIVIYMNHQTTESLPNIGQFSKLNEPVGLLKTLDPRKVG
jgi:hypothetical protein